MINIKVYDLDYEDIANICANNDVMEWEVIEAMLNVIRDERIDINEWL